MAEYVKVPMFPLSIFPLPGEMVPLHIFEPRYRQLLDEVETKNINFGIYFNDSANTAHLGSWVKLESVLKRYPGGESDIVVKCVDLFEMSKLYRTYDDKSYPGGDVRFWNTSLTETVSEKLLEEFEAYRLQLNIKLHDSLMTAYYIANELALDFTERVKFALMSREKRESFLISRLRYQKQLLTYVEKSKDVFHLN
jgi:hypothetical protein